MHKNSKDKSSILLRRRNRTRRNDSQLGSMPLETRNLAFANKYLKMRQQVRSLAEAVRS